MKRQAGAGDEVELGLGSHLSYLSSVSTERTTTRDCRAVRNSFLIIYTAAARHGLVPSLQQPNNTLAAPRRVFDKCSVLS